MIDTRASELTPLRAGDIEKLIHSRGPCLTVTLPPHHGGTRAPSAGALLKSLLQTAAQKLDSGKVAELVAADLLSPLERIAEDEALPEGSHFGRVIFRAPGVLERFQLVEPCGATIAVASHFQIRPFLAEVSGASEFYLLELTAKNISLKRCDPQKLSAVHLPHGVPETFDEAMAFEKPDHNLENRSPAGSSLGSMRRIRFGTGSERESRQMHLSDFYRIIDHAIADQLKAKTQPLVLVGVDEDTTLYRSVSSYPNLLPESISGSPEKSMGPDELRRRAHELVRCHSVQKAANALASARETLAPNRFLTRLYRILEAAVDGKVSRLYVDVETKVEGLFVTSDPRLGAEELYNVAVVETLRNGGEAFALPGDKMPDGAPAVAILRY